MTRKDAVPVLRFAIFFALLFLLLILRRPDALTNPQPWAEDGLIFVTQQLTEPGWGVLWKPYNGYLQMVPRLVTAIAALFPAAYLPLVMNLCALAIAAGCAGLFALNRYRWLLASDGLRMAVCLVLATAFQSDEMIGTVNCLHVWLLVGALLVVLQPPEAYRGRSGYVLLALGLLAGLSTPAVVILVPVAAVLAIRWRGKAWLPLAVVTVTAGVQVAMHLATGDHPARERLADIAGATLTGVVYRGVLVSLAGLTRVQGLPGRDFPTILVFTAILLTIWLTMLWQRRDRALIAGALYLMIASIALAIAGRSVAHEHFGSTGIRMWHAERYFFLAASGFAYLVALTVERWPRWAPLLLLAVFAGGIRGNFQTAAFTDHHWRQHAPAIDRWRRDRAAHRPTPAVAVPINPWAPWAPWQVNLPATQ